MRCKHSGGVTFLVMPKLPFSLFNYEYIIDDKPLYDTESAAAGNVISHEIRLAPGENVDDEIPSGRMMWLRSFVLGSAKTTGTALSVYIVRKKWPGSSWTGKETLFAETIGTDVLSWPFTTKLAAGYELGNCILMLFPGDKIAVAHALTAAETIVHEYTIQRILYDYDKILGVAD